MQKHQQKRNEITNKIDQQSQLVHFKGNRSEASKQLKVQDMANQAVQRKKNKTGIPDNLKSGIENLSGIDISDVKVHYNSSQPAQLQAHAFAQGNQIHLASGQEKHLPHEAWHVVQQKQGRVAPTKQLKGKVNINDDSGLEKEADLMGAKALQMKYTTSTLKSIPTFTNTVQRSITVTKEQLTYSNAKWAFKSLQSSFKDISQKDLLAILEIMDENNEKFHDFKNLKYTIESKYKSVQNLNHFEVTPDEWIVLHRLKSQSFYQFMAAKHGLESDLQTVKETYEKTDAKYNPAKFGDSPQHNWTSNDKWLDLVPTKFSKAVLTDLPLSETNIYRQTHGESGFSAYAREIASLLYDEFYPIGKKTLPAAKSWNAVAMVKEDLIPETIRPEIKKKIKIDDDKAVKIYNNQTDDIGTGATFTFFKNAGLPTNKRQKDITQSLHELAPVHAIITKLKSIIPDEFDWDGDNKSDWQELFQQHNKELKWLGINGWTGLRRQARINKSNIA